MTMDKRFHARGGPEMRSKGGDRGDRGQRVAIHPLRCVHNVGTCCQLGARKRGRGVTRVLYAS
jgi:hypothetical protein